MESFSSDVQRLLTSFETSSHSLETVDDKIDPGLLDLFKKSVGIFEQWPNPTASEKMRTWTAEAEAGKTKWQNVGDAQAWVKKVTLECLFIGIPYKNSLSSPLFGLKENWWKVLIDYEFQKYGELVFDLGLHSKDKKEPGCLGSLLNAYSFAAGKLARQPAEHPNSVFYSLIHQIATRHFEEGIGDVLAGGLEIGGKPRTFGVGANMSFSAFPSHVTDANRERYIDSVKEEWQHGLILEDRFCPEFTIGEGVCTLQYKEVEGISRALDQLFTQFKNKISELDAQVPPDKEAKLRLVASLFQKLEWLHPFADGQGRTDLIFLNYLLVRYGFTPAILEKPYLSSVATLDDWVIHLKEGMTRWQEEKAKIDAGSASTA